MMLSTALMPVFTWLLLQICTSQKRPRTHSKRQCRSTRLVLEACNRFDVRLLFGSTVCAYGNNGYEQSDEDAPSCTDRNIRLVKGNCRNAIIDPFDKHCILRLVYILRRDENSSIFMVMESKLDVHNVRFAQGIL